VYLFSIVDVQNVLDFTIRIIAIPFLLK